MLRYALVFLPLVACNGCGHDPAPPPTAPASQAASGDPVVSVDDDGKSFDLARGATLTLKLANTGGTGYAWLPAEVDAKILAQQGDTTSEVQTPGLPGGPKVDVLKFLAVGPGTATLEVDLKRPFGHDAPAKVVKVTVNVK